MAKTQKENITDESTVNTKVAVSDVLEEVKKQEYEMVVIVGLDKQGETNVTASNNALPMVHWLLNRAEFEMNLFEKNSRDRQKKEAAEKKEEKSEIVTPDTEIITPK